MAGVLFIICIPTIGEEAKLTGHVSNDTEYNVTAAAAAAGSSTSAPHATTKALNAPLADNKTPTRFNYQYGTFPTQESRLATVKETSTNLKESDVDSVAKAGRNEFQLDIETSSSVCTATTSAATTLTSSETDEKLRKNLAKRLKTASGQKESPCELDLSSDSSMVDVIKAMIAKMYIENAVWTEGNSLKKWQIIFSVEAGPRSDNIVRILNEWGIGDRAGSFVSILPCIKHKNAAENSSAEGNFRESQLDQQREENSWGRFVSSVTARLNVVQLVEEVRASAQFSFDFIVLLIVASLVAMIGLVEDNSLFLAASMLISPLMGPIIAATFGTTIKDKSLQWFGVVNELLGILIVTVVGFICGLIISLVDERFCNGNGLTEEMINRSLLHSVMVGIFVAIPSGIAVAIGILGDNFGSLAGVAISASLLPPAVNTGLMLAFAAIFKIYETDGEHCNKLTNTNHYSDHQSIELAVMGLISMCVTITNVISVYIMGIVFLKIKEVAPIVPSSHRQFWKHDVKIARDYNKTHTTEQTATFRMALENEIAGYEQTEPSRKAELLRHLERHFSGHEKTWSPNTGNFFYHTRTSMRDIFDTETEQSHATKYNHQWTISPNSISNYVHRRASIATQTLKHAPSSSSRGRIIRTMGRIREQSGGQPNVNEMARSHSPPPSLLTDDMDSAKNQRSSHKFLVVPVPEQQEGDKADV